MDLRLLVIAVLCTVATANVVVETVYGSVSGYNFGNVNIFNSIPFAAPPTNDLRFRAPEPPTKWSGIKDASGPSWVCPQLKIDGNLLLGNEDCLYLHLWAPANATADSNLPVMFWIFGGGYVIGDGDEFGWYDGSHLAEHHNMIVVAPNYRLGPYGFMALEELQNEDPNHSTGNMALLDQRQAMIWVKENIAAFGGNPNHVAIFGESAGGFSVCWHLASPGSAALFHAAVMESGTCDAPQFFQTYEYATSFSRRYAAAIGCSSTGQELLDCLRSRSTEDVLKSLLDWFNPNWPDTSSIMEEENKHNSDTSESPLFDVTLRNEVAQRAITTGLAQRYSDKPISEGDTELHLKQVPVNEYLSTLMGIGRATRLFGSNKHGRRLRGESPKSAGIPLPALSPIMPWGPCIDGTQYAMPARPLTMFQRGTFNRVPTIFGTNKDEGSIFAPMLPIIQHGASFPPDTQSLEASIKKLLNPYLNQTLLDIATQKILAEYPSSAYPENNWGRTSDIITHYFFTCANRRAARAIVTASNAPPLWLYHFTHKLDWIESWIFGHGLLGDYHTSELCFVWDNQWPIIIHGFSAADQILSNEMTTYWTDMARYRTPNVHSKTVWPQFQYTSNNITNGEAYMQLKTPLETGNNLLDSKCDFWDSLVMFLERGGEY